MPRLLPIDCLNDIFENLEQDKITLHSCILVNRVWCQVSVKILWRNIWDFKYTFDQHRLSTILNTFIACLPSESKELLHKNGIFISTSTSKSPLFNYAAFCKVLSIDEIARMINKVLKNDSPITSSNINNRNCLVTKELIKMFMNQSSSLKKLTCYLTTHYLSNYNNAINGIIPGARDCLKYLSELCCGSNINSGFFYQLSQICHNLQSLSIEFVDGNVSNGLKELISLQRNLKYLSLSAYGRNDWSDIIPDLTNHSNTLTKLHLYSDNGLSLSFVSLLSNLQEIKFGINSEDFKELQYVSFPKLRVLKIPYDCPKPEYLMKFLENNGKNLDVLYINENDNTLNLSVAKFCPNLKKLFVIFNNEGLDTLKIIFNSCKYLESIKIRCGEGCLSEKEALEIVAKHSPKNFYELKIYNDLQSELLPDDLESFFISWKDRSLKKSLSLIINKYNRLEEVNEENMKIIEKYKSLGIIKKFE